MESKRSGSLPPPKKASSTDRVVVTLSSVAKTPPPLPPPGVAAVTAPPKQVPALASADAPQSIFPAKALSSKPAEEAERRQPQFNRTVQVKLPPKNGVLPKLTTLSSMPLSAAGSKREDMPVPEGPTGLLEPAQETPHLPPPLPKSVLEEKNTGAPRAPAFRLKPLRVESPGPEGSIFAEETGAPAARASDPGEAQKIDGDVADVLIRAPGLREESSAKLAGGLLPPPLPVEKIVAPLHAPPLVTQPGVERTEKMRLPPALRKTGATESDVPHPPALVEPATASPAPPADFLPVDPPLDPAFAPVLPSAAKAGEDAPKLVPPLATSISTAAALTPVVEPVTSIPLQSVPPAIASPSVREEKPALTPASGAPVDADSFGLLLSQPELPVATTKSQFPAVPVRQPVQSGPTEPPPPPIKKPVELPLLAGLFARKQKPVSLVPRSPEPEKKPTGLAVRSTTLSRAKMAAGYSTTPMAAMPAVESEAVPDAALVPASTEPPVPPEPQLASDTPPPRGRTERTRKRRFIGTVVFYAIFLGVIVPLLFFLGLDFSSETRIEGQVIPPPGTMLCNEVWIVSDFRELASGIADDLAAERAPKIQEIQERQDHVQRAQADIAAREERIRLLNEQIQATKDEITSVIKQAHDAAQQVWDGPGAALEDEYKSRLDQLQATVADRAKSLNLKYTPDTTYQSPEVWANAYRLALYQTPAGVDGVKEHKWIEDQITAWRAYTKTFDDRKDKLRAQAAQIQLSPTTKVTDLNNKVEDLQHRVDSTEAEEDPLKTELQQAQADLTQAQAGEANLDGKYYQELYALPESSITKRLPLMDNGRFSWLHVEKDSAFSQGDRTHSYWIFSRAVRKDGRQYWVMAHFSIGQNTLLPIVIEPASFVSTKTILRPDLSADEQTQ